MRKIPFFRNTWAMVRQPSGDVEVVSTTSIYSGKIASQTTRTMTEMVLCGTLQPNVMAEYCDPNAICCSLKQGVLVPGMRCAVS